MTSRKSSGSSPRRECRRADQIAEHHRQLPALGLTGGSRRRSGCQWRFGRTEGGDGVEQATAMATQHDAKILEIFRGELGQCFQVDLVLAKCRFVTLKPETS
jgi:hypothetical protein